MRSPGVRTGLTRRSVLLPAGIAAALSVARLRAQDDSAPRPASFRTGSALVLVPVTVVDRHGSIVNGLPASAFSVVEDGVRQEISSFSQQDTPVSLGIVFDVSNSMQPMLSTAKVALRALLEDANPGDEAFLNTVSTLPAAKRGFTRDLGQLLEATALECAHGGTALIDTVYASLNELKRGHYQRKALLVISDGMDNHSSYSRTELLSLAVETDAQVHCVVADSAPQTAKPMAVQEQHAGWLFLNELAARTGGLSMRVSSVSEVPGATARIGRALRNQYTIGYKPSASSRGGKLRRIRVRLNDAQLKAYSRTEYRSD